MQTPKDHGRNSLLVTYRNQASGRLKTGSKGFRKSTSSASPEQPSVDPSVPCDQHHAPVAQTTFTKFSKRAHITYGNDSTSNKPAALALTADTKFLAFCLMISMKNCEYRHISLISTINYCVTTYV